MATEPQSAVLAWLDRHFSVELPFLRFARNIVLLSLAGFVPVPALYIALSLHMAMVGGAANNMGRRAPSGHVALLTGVSALLAGYF